MRTLVRNIIVRVLVVFFFRDREREFVVFIMNVRAFFCVLMSPSNVSSSGFHGR